MFDWLGGMFGGIFDTLSESVSEAIFAEMMAWIYTQIYDAVAEFFTMMGNLGVEIFELPWIASAVQFFSLLGWSLFAVGMIVAIFDVAVEAQSGHVSIKSASLNIIKGFMAAGLFTTVPVELYKFCISLQNTFAGDLSGVFISNHTIEIGRQSMTVLEATFLLEADMAATFFNLVTMIAFAYCVVKIFFDNIKRGGILLIQISVGSLYMFSVPRGYADGFMQWCKQVIALCLTAFMQTTILFLGLLTFSNSNLLLGLGIMLAASEVPRIAQQFGLDSSVRFNMMSAVHATSMAVNLTRNIARTAK